MQLLMQQHPPGKNAHAKNDGGGGSRIDGVLCARKRACHAKAATTKGLQLWQELQSEAPYAAHRKHMQADAVLRRSGPHRRMDACRVRWTEERSKRAVVCTWASALIRSTDFGALPAESSPPPLFLPARHPADAG